MSCSHTRQLFQSNLEVSTFLRRLQSAVFSLRLPADRDMAFLAICFIIFLGSVLAGLLPFGLRVSEQQVGLLSAFGAGMLVSTALAVILPEGMEAFHEANAESEGSIPHAVMGLTMVAGFAFMLLADHLQGQRGHLKSRTRDSDEDLRDAERALTASPMDSNRYIRRQQEAGTRAYVGLLIHSLADGVAVGATGMTDKEDLKLVVAFAMVLHKVPATFGLVSFLIASKWSRRGIQAALVGFASSAPLMALATYWLLGSIPGFSSPTAVALWLLASGGTFLYASCMHVLPHIAHADHSSGSSEHSLTNGQLLGVLTGCAVPIIIQFLGHGHHH